jgi:hypothetical protein
LEIQIEHLEDSQYILFKIAKRRTAFNDGGVVAEVTLWRAEATESSVDKI